MPHALLLSPDDQAVSAITGVLEEMSVTCERPLDGVSAAQKLSSQSFDLVLVDCENLPAAKLIFDVCRRGKNGNNPVPIAIVDGRAGLPTAFRLGAELILTKPVAKDQARSTIRTAVSRLRKDLPAADSVSAGVEGKGTADVADEMIGAIIGTSTIGTSMIGTSMTGTSMTGTSMTGGAMTGAGITEDDASAMPTVDASSQLTSFAEPPPKFISTPAPRSIAISVAKAAVIDAGAAAHSAPGLTTARPFEKTPNSPAARLSRENQSSRAAQLTSPATANWKSPLAMKPSDDPVLAELEKTEQEEEERKNAKPAEAAAKQAAEVQSPYRQSQPRNNPKRKGALVGVLMLALACGGFYGAWTYQPGFRAMAQPAIDRLLTLIGMALPPTEAPKPAKTSTSTPVAVTSTAPAAGSPVETNQTSSTLPGSAAPTNVATGSPATASPLPAEGSGNSTTIALAIGQPETHTSAAPEPGANKLADSKLADSKLVDTKKAESTASSEAPHSAESNAIILSSQGAEKRLLHKVPPKYPVEARARGAQGTIVLKTVVDKDGKVANLRLVEGNAALSAAAIEAVKQWRYRPYVRDGKAQPFQTVVIVDFQRP
jgi:protein TonB